MDIYYIYSSNGDGFVEQNLLTGEVRDFKLKDFPSPEDLYQRYRIDKGIDEAWREGYARAVLLHN